MQVQRTGNKVVHTLGGRLRIGGVWYNRGDDVELDAADAAVYAGRGLSSAARPGAVPKNAKPTGPETLKASLVPLQAKTDGTVPKPEEEDAPSDDTPSDDTPSDSKNSKGRGNVRRGR